MEQGAKSGRIAVSTFDCTYEPCKYNFEINKQIYPETWNVQGTDKKHSLAYGNENFADTWEQQRQ